LRNKLELLRSQLAGPEATALERLLVDRVVLSWLALHEAELADVRAEGRTMAQGDYHRRRVDSLHRRYLAAVRTMATVRRLAAPILRVKLNAHPGANGKAAGPAPKAAGRRFALPPVLGNDG